VSIVAEARSFGQWVGIDIETVLKQPRSRVMRSPECHGHVRAHREGATGQKAHTEHQERNAGCSRGDCFDGQPRRHPHALA
jgi:hypothetical protein